jgi:hypothetical protein
LSEQAYLAVLSFRQDRLLHCFSGEAMQSKIGAHEAYSISSPVQELYQPSDFVEIAPQKAKQPAHGWI